MNVIKYKNKQKEWDTATKPLNPLGLSFATLSILSFLHGFDLRQASTNRLAMATFWPTFNHDDKLSPAC
jgi:hypothetical protein